MLWWSVLNCSIADKEKRSMLLKFIGNYRQSDLFLLTRNAINERLRCYHHLIGRDQATLDWHWLEARGNNVPFSWWNMWTTLCVTSTTLWHQTLCLSSCQSLLHIFSYNVSMSFIGRFSVPFKNTERSRGRG